MNEPTSERIWEGVIEVLRSDEALLSARARLWRRDDVFGTDWGGQLQIPVNQRKNLPAGEYRIVLGPGREGRAFIGLGASDTASTFPTLTGAGAPPFGGAAIELDPVALDALEPSAGAAAPAPAAAAAAVATLEPPALQSTPPATDERQDSHMPDPSPATPEAQPATMATVAPAAPARPVVEAPSEPAQMQAPAPAPVEFAPPAQEPLDATIEQTEALARAFLCAVEVRSQLQSMRGQGLEGNVLASLRVIVDEVTGHIESRLRSQGGAPAAPRLAAHLTVLGWARVVAAGVGGRGDLEDLSRLLGRLVQALESEAHTHRGPMERAAA